MHIYMTRTMDSTRSLCLKDLVIFSGSIGTNSRRSMLLPEIFSFPTGVSCGRLVSDRSMIISSLNNSGLIMTALPRRISRTDNIISLRNSHRFNMISSANYCYKRRENSSSTIRLIRANSSPDEQGDHYLSTSNGILYVLRQVIAGILGLLIRFPKVFLGFLLTKKARIEKFEEEVEQAAEVVEDVARKVREIAETTEEIAERIEGESGEEGTIHQAAEFLDNISHEVAKDAKMVENVAEKISETAKTVDVDVESAIDAVEDLADMFSGDKTKDSSKETDSSIPTVETKDSTMKYSVDVNASDNTTKLMEIDGIRRLVWFVMGGAFTSESVPRIGLMLAASIVAVFCTLCIALSTGHLPLQVLLG